MTMRILCTLVAVLLPSFTLADETLPVVSQVELQPFVAQVKRLTAALDAGGTPLSEQQASQLQAAFAKPSEAIVAIQKVLDPLCLAYVQINPESRVKVVEGPAPKQLMEQGWRSFLVKVHNEGGVTSQLRCTSPNALPLQVRSTSAADPLNTISQQDVVNRWLDIHLPGVRPLKPTLSGLLLEYRIIELYSRDTGSREAQLSFDVGQGTEDLAFRAALPILFHCQPSVTVKLAVLDTDGSPTTAHFTFRDQRQRVYPARSRRLAPDFFFHDQVYRSHQETVRLPAGLYHVRYSRGPEYRVLEREITVPEVAEHTETFQLERWIELASKNWYSGDHHIHAAGCSHYESPTKGVEPLDMMRHILGEDLNVGCVLTWGPCWYHQKQFFDGKTSALSTSDYLMRYDVEVSGFPSSPCGHLVLLRLSEDDYPGTERIEQWPSWDLPVLQWAQQQGGVVGFAHSGWGLAVSDDAMPSYEIPPFDGIGANEYIVDVTHNAVDFISTVDTPPVWELSIWYHTLNCGFTTRISGETDFPCIYDQRVGLGRTYVKLSDDVPLNFENWVQGLKVGRSYCSDGLSHLFDFSVNGLGVGETGTDKRASFLQIGKGELLRVKANVASFLAEQPREAIRRQPSDQQPFWHTERARVADSRQVAVELIVNGQAVEKAVVTADGSVADVQFEYTPERSCWVALRVFPAAHTNPIFVEVDGQPIRASKRSAQWCLDSVDQCWRSKLSNIRATERSAAQAAYDHARTVYQLRLQESYDDRVNATP